MMKNVTTKMMKELANTGAEVIYTRNNGDTRIGEFVSGEFIDALGKTFIRDLAFVYDEAIGNATFVSKKLDEKDFKVDVLINDKETLEDIAKKGNEVLYHSPKTGEWVLGSIKTGHIVTCKGDEYDKKLAFVSNKPFGEDDKYDINANKIWEKEIIIVYVDDEEMGFIPSSEGCGCGSSCTCVEKEKEIKPSLQDQIESLQKQIDILKQRQEEEEEVIVAREVVTIKEDSTLKFSSDDKIIQTEFKDNLKLEFVKKGRVVTCNAYDDECNFITDGVAICLPQDEFNVGIGMDIAHAKMRIKLAQIELDNIIKDLN